MGPDYSGVYYCDLDKVYIYWCKCYVETIIENPDQWSKTECSTP